MASLLGQFYNKINGSQEDIASEGLVYILQQSFSAKEALHNYFNNTIGITFTNINYITQSIGEKNERPDISGINEDGEEVIILEAKFWASLTENQPIEYLERLKENSVLLFICPNLRKDSLNHEIGIKLSNSQMSYKYENYNYKFEKNKYMFIIDWFTILEIIKSNLIKNNERLLISDIDQIIGFCEVIDNYSFFPIQSYDLSPSIPKRMNSYSDLIDKVLDKLQNNYSINIIGFRAAPQKYGYTKYFSTEKYGLAFDFNMKMWELFADTPFWFTVKLIIGKEWQQPIEFQNILKNISQVTNFGLFKNFNNDFSFALVPKLNEVEDIVINDIVYKIIAILEKIE